jgi:hypothetical protein
MVEYTGVLSTDYTQQHGDSIIKIRSVLLIVYTSSFSDLFRSILDLHTHFKYVKKLFNDNFKIGIFNLNNCIYNIHINMNITKVIV